MKTIFMTAVFGASVLGVATSLLAMSGARAQGSSDKPLSAVPPAGAHDHSADTIQAPRPAPSSQAGGTVVPGPGYAHGTANVGNSSETNGMPGSQGAGASATMQNGHTSNR